MLKVVSLTFFVGDVACKLVTINPSAEGDLLKQTHFQHSHSGYEIHYLSAGELSVDCIGSHYQLSEGQMLIIPPGVYHYIRGISQDIRHMSLLLEIGQGQRSKDPQLDRFLQGLLRKQPILLWEDAQGEIVRVLKQLRHVAVSMEENTAVQQEWLKAMCLELVLLMGTVAKEIRSEETSSAPDDTDLNIDRYIMDQFFNHNYHGNSSMEMLAKELNMSLRQTGRILQKTYGKSFREKMNECRLAVAMDLLKNTAKSMTEISELLGYGEPANFSSFIKRQTGKTPAQIRKG